MATEIQSADAGVDFDGTAMKGEFLFPTVKSGDATQRGEVFSVAVQSDEDLTTVRVVLAPNKEGAEDITFLQIINAENVDGSQVVGCNFLVPQGWGLFAFATGNGRKKLIIDWNPTTKVPRC